MTGQILAGAPIKEAVHFQQIIMFMMVSCTSLSTILSILVRGSASVMNLKLNLRWSLIGIRSLTKFAALHLQGTSFLVIDSSLRLRTDKISPRTSWISLFSRFISCTERKVRNLLCSRATNSHRRGSIHI
jgi:hypothetical protein